MDQTLVIGNIAHIYIVLLVFYGMVFALAEITTNKNIPQAKRLPAIIILVLLNIVTGQLLFLLIGIYGAAWTQTRMQKKKV